MADPSSGASDQRSPSILPATLDRAAMERVMARAAELQVSHAEPSDGMSEAQLIEVGQEVGITAEHLRQALAEERTRVAVPQQSGIVASLFGGEMASASRVIRGTPSQLLALLDQWMQRDESLRTKRRFTDRLTWEARQGVSDTLTRAFNRKGRAYALLSANEVAGTVVAIDAERCIVRLDADLSDSRRRRVGASAVVGGGMVATAAGLVALTLSLPGASALVGGVVGSVWAASGVAVATGLATAQKRKLERSQLALEQILDRLEHGEIRKSGNPLAELIDVVAKSVDIRR